MSSRTGTGKAWRLAVLALLAIISGLLMADDSSKTGLQNLMKSLSEVKSRTSHFTETKTLALLDIPLELKGTLIFNAPDHIEKHTNTPDKSAYIVRGSELKLQLPGQPERKLVLYQYEGIQAFVESLRATLAGDLKTLKEYYEVGYQGKGPDWTLTLEPLSEEVDAFVKQIVIRGKHNEITSINTAENNGDRSIMTLHRVP